ncbi:hypothetical protein [Rossellomorea marisflavi]|uniref:hypothetical protein n=1 Tax=Rossellomorea marisflavi TaxID=189381 RepID=UPI00064F8F4F|nr:hypothetical protein [Rossellomorea marisflavi]KML31519.1 hypothetical protein VL12_17435 [Rossellomorea marisflavi]
MAFIILNLLDEKTVTLESSLEHVSDEDEIQTYEFMVKPIEKGDHTIQFGLIQDIGYAFGAVDDNGKKSYPENTIKAEIPNREKGETITLTQQDELIYPISIDTNQLDPGVYDLNVSFSGAENVEVSDQTISNEID